MGVFAAGQVVVLPFPFSDLTRNKYRPALLIADAGRNDWIACQITSNPYTDNHSMVLTDMDFQRGNLAHISYVRPTKLFTAHEALVEQIIGSVRNKFLDQVRESIIRVIREQE